MAGNLTVEEYLALEEQSEERHEYLNGQMVAMSEASLDHADRAAAIQGHLYVQLKGTGCKVRGSGVRIRTLPEGLYCYPDVVISCKPEQVERNTLLNPVVIVEVLSESTGDYDRGEKFKRYRQIPSFAEYIVFAQNEVYVEHHVRDQARAVWTMREFRSIDDVLTLESVPVSLPLSAVFNGLTSE